MIRFGEETVTPGWYVDPWRERPLRWWDGEAWTAATADEHAADAPPQVLELRTRDLPPGFSPEALPFAITACVVAVLASAVSAVVVVMLDLADEWLVTAPSVALALVMVVACQRASEEWGNDLVSADLGFRFRASDLLFGPLACLAGVVATMPFWHFTDDDGPNGIFGTGPSTSVIVLLAVATVVVAPLVEELFFRGLLQRTLTSGVGSSGAVLLQAILFGTCHLDPTAGWGNVAIVGQTGMIGLTYGLVAARRRSLGTTIVAHALHNAVAVYAAFG